VSWLQTYGTIQATSIPISYSEVKENTFIDDSLDEHYLLTVLSGAT